MSRSMIALAGSVHLLTSVAQGQFVGLTAPVVFSSSGINAHAVAVADFNLDGVNDIIVQNAHSVSTGSVMALRNLGNGAFADAISVCPTLGPADLAVGDINNDGITDVVIGSGASANNTSAIAVYLGTGENTWTAGPGLSGSAVGKVVSIALGDIDGDGDLDIVAGRKETTDVLVMRNEHPESRFSHFYIPTPGGEELRITVADINSDGFADIVAMQPQLHRLCAILTDGPGSFSEPVFYQADAPPYDACTADLDNDGDIDLAIYTWQSGRIQLLLNNGSGEFSQGLPTPQFPFSVLHAAAPQLLQAADMDGDGDTDLVFLLHGENQVNVLVNMGGAVFERRMFNVTGATECRSIAVGELFADGSPDVVVANYIQTGEVHVLRNTSPFLPPTGFALISPANQITNVTPAAMTFVWTAAHGFEIRYVLRIAADLDFNQVLHTSPSLVGTSYLLPAGVLEPSRRYYWSVTASNSQGAVSSTPVYRTFVTSIPGDINGDGWVDFVDLNILLSHFGIHP